MLKANQDKYDSAKNIVHENEVNLNNEIKSKESQNNFDTLKQVKIDFDEILNKLSSVDSIMLLMKNKQESLDITLDKVKEELTKIPNVDQISNKLSTFFHNQYPTSMPNSFGAYVPIGVHPIGGVDNSNIPIVSKTNQETISILEKPKQINSKKYSKRDYKKLSTESLIEELVVKKYPSFPVDLRNEVYTIDGTDLFINVKNKKWPLTNLGDLISIINKKK